MTYTQSFLSNKKSPLLHLSLIMVVFIAIVIPMKGTNLIRTSSVHESINMPLVFIPASNQIASYESVSLNGGFIFSPSGVSVSLPDSGAAQIRFLGASSSVTLVPENRKTGIINRISGRDPSLWKTNIPTFGAVKYQDLYNGIDLRYYGHEGLLKGTFYVAPGADPDMIRWVYKGGQEVKLDPVTGDLRIVLQGGGTLVEKAPIAWQETNGEMKSVKVNYFVQTEGIGFTLGKYNHNLPLVIDPELVYGSYAGGSSGDYARGITVDAQGNTYIVGDTISTDFLGYNGTVNGSNEVILLKINPTASDLVYGTILGGSSVDKGMAVAVNSVGEAYITVDAGSTDFPLKNPLFPSQNDSNQGALLKFSTAGDLVFSTWLPFNVMSTFSGRNIAVDSQGNVIVAGELYTAIHTARDLAVLKINPAGTQVLFDKRWTDDSVSETPTAAAIGPNNSIYITGTVFDLFGGFPVTANAVQPVCGRKIAQGMNYNCDDDAFIIVLDTAGNPTYVSYLGGLGDDDGTGIAVGPNGSVVVVGNTFSADFPTTGGSLMPSCKQDPTLSACYYDTFVTKIKPEGSSLDWSTYLNSNDSNVLDFSKGIAIDSNGNVYVTGYTAGSHFPVMNPIQNSLALGNCSGTFTRFCFDTTITEFDANGGLVFSTYLGGNDDEYTGGLALDPQGNIYVAGYSYSANFPTTSGALQTGANLGSEFYIAKISAENSGPVNLPNKVYVPIAIR